MKQAKPNCYGHYVTDPKRNSKCITCLFHVECKKIKPKKGTKK